MSTIDDDATANEAFRLAEALKYRKPELFKYGICQNCYAPSKGVYCCAECREDGEARVRMTGKVL